MMTTGEMMAKESARLLDATLDALPSYHLAGIDHDVTDALLRRDGLLREEAKQ